MSATVLGTMTHKQDNPFVVVISTTASPLILVHLTPQTSTWLIIICVAQLRERERGRERVREREKESIGNHCNLKDEHKARIMVAFTNLKKESVQRCNRFGIHLEAEFEAIRNFIE